ncbi:M24 family metallopeptidase [Rubrimonas cliftonensis]|uniref:Xaa-Pro aminopeptidase n=1 Tax=Rubrimonas cliftonensis TaxID=89524 RepID=A0A1H4CME9_9RHOB|nr:Xaa-Pro peptidase family protein [Rubrimonas cliftonensis]SEA61499.1 Xaa-Pro aminopeptidase [Rubrimonas cliftonensis]
MSCEAGGFCADEHRRRVAALQRGMTADGIDALLLTTPPDVFYVCGFLTRFWESPARPWFLLVPATGDPVAVIPAIGAPLMRRGWIADVRTWDAPDPRDDGVGLLAAALREMLPPRGRLGAPMGAETHLRMPQADLARLLALIAPATLVDATGALRGAREIKSEAEIARIRAACRVADAAFAGVGDFAGSGRRLDDVFRDFQIALLREGADWVGYLAGGAGPDGCEDVISPADGRELRRGDVLMLDAGAVKAGYFCDFDRNFAIGGPSDAARRAHAALHAATDAALSAARPGMRACDLHGVMARALQAQGAAPLGGRFGHGLGVSLTEWPSLSPLDETPLRAGMVLTLEPGVEVAPGRIMVHEENVALRKDGPELLSARAPAELPALD